MKPNLVWRASNWTQRTALAVDQIVLQTFFTENYRNRHFLTTLALPRIENFIIFWTKPDKNFEKAKKKIIQKFQENDSWISCQGTSGHQAVPFRRQKNYVWEIEELWILLLSIFRWLDIRCPIILISFSQNIHSLTWHIASVLLGLLVNWQLPNKFELNKYLTKPSWTYNRPVILLLWWVQLTLWK